MGKKIHARDLREQRKNDRTTKFAEQNKKREAQMAVQKKDAAVSAKSVSSVSSKKGNVTKSMAKAAGVKSVFAVGKNTVYMTSFGRGNDAVLEQKIVDTSHEPLNIDDPAYQLNVVTMNGYSVTGHRGETVSAITDNPLRRFNGGKKDKPEQSVPADMLCLKPTLEKKFFGKEFDDNIHIQLIYNILDIEKILAVYSTNAVYALNNTIADENNENWDLFANFSTDNTYGELINAATYKESTDDVSTDDEKRREAEKKKREAKIAEKILADYEKFRKNNRLAYFADAFYIEKNKSKSKSQNKAEGIKRGKKEIYSILALIAKLRHWCVHSEDGRAEFWLYKLDELEDDFKNVLDVVYNRPVEEINDDFVERNKVNIQILHSKCENSDIAELTRSYYEFLITKKYKNMGFSIKKLREIILEGTEYNDNKYDTVRNKLYQMVDFILYRGYINENSERAEALVNALRSTLNEDDKTKLYSSEAAFLKRKYMKIIREVTDSLDVKKLKELKKNAFTIPDNELRKCFISYADSVSEFTKLIYLLTRFLSGKEINDLVTTLINKFDNIRSFLEIMDELGLERTFTDEYSFFEGSTKYLAELIELNSFVKSCSFDMSAKRPMYRDALDILGIESDKSEDDIKRMIDNILQVDANGKKLPNKNHGLRNFIASNVVESNRFEYLVRYGNPKKIRETAKCKPAVRFVLNEIPDAQIERYYKAYYLDEKSLCLANMQRDKLAGVIADIKFDDFSDAGSYQKANATSTKITSEAEIKRKNQAIIRLYLTVMYIMLKNLVNVNARYVIAFHCLERDTKLYAESGLEVGNIEKNKTNLTMAVMGVKLENGIIKTEFDKSLAENAANRYLRNARWYKLILDNLKMSERAVVNEFRNTVCHLNAIRNININIDGIKEVENYFALYHYLIQKHLENRFADNGGSTGDYIGKLEEHKTYCKDFVKAYCTPFGYNLVRYKNLTIDGLFDKNYPGKDDSDKQK